MKARNISSVIVLLFVVLALPSQALAFRVYHNASQVDGGTFGAGNPSPLQNYTFPQNVVINSNLGIGTATPSRTLHVEGDSSNVRYIRIQNTGANQAGIELTAGSPQNTWVGPYMPGIDELRFWSQTLNDDVLTMKPSGNVGIGTTTPGSTLEVVGSSRFKYASNGDNGGVSFGGGIWSIEAAQSASPAHFSIMEDTAPVGDGTVVRHFVVEAGGNVGIGTMDPSQKLEVVGSAARFGDGGSFLFDLNVPAVNTVGARFNVGGAERLTILGDGNVGIGVTNPQYTLQVNGALHATNVTLASGGSITTNGGSIGSTYIAQNVWGRGRDASNNGIGLSTNRLLGANTGRYTITTSPSYSTEYLFDGLYDQNTVIVPAGTTQSTTIDFNPQLGWGVNSGSGFTYANGILVLTFYHTNLPSNVDVEQYYYNTSTGTDMWRTIYSTTNNTQNPVIIPTSQNNYIKRLRINVSSSSTDVWITEYEWFSTREGDTRQLANVPKYSYGPVDIATPSLNFKDTSWSTVSAIKNDGDAYFGGSVGIGTTTPYNRLEVRQDTAPSEKDIAVVYTKDNGVQINSTNLYGSLKISNEWSGSAPAPNAKLAKLMFHTATDNGWNAYGSIFLDANTGSAANKGNLKFATADANANLATRMTIDGNGNVGVGTTSPASILHARANTGNLIIQDADTTSSSLTAYISLLDSVGTTFGALGFSEGNNAYLDIKNYANAPVRIFTNNQNRVQIAADGNVGIGVTSPATKLDVAGKIKLSDDGTSAQAGMIRYASNSFQGYNGTAWLVLAGGSSSSSNYWQANGQKIYYNDGNIGIGTNDPAQKLHVQDAETPRLRVTDTTSSVSAEVAADDSATYFQSFSNHPVYIRTNNQPNTGYIYLNTNGNVGIGTTSPAYRLVVESPATNQYPLHLKTTGAPGAGWLFKVDNATGDMRIHEENVGDRFTFQRGGNVGIGTTDPATNFRLHVEGGDLLVQKVAPALRLRDTTSSHYFQTEVRDGPTWNLLSSQGGAETSRIFVNGSSGNVGIGTTTPTTLLHLYKAGASELMLRADNPGSMARIKLDGDTGTGDAGGDIQFRYNGTFLGDISMRNVGSPVKSMRFTVGSSERMVIDTSGRVGIGAVTPQTNIHVRSDADAAILLEADTGSGTEDRNAYLKFLQDSGGVSGVVGLVGDAGRDPENNVLAGTASNSLLISNNWNDANSAVHFGTRNTVRMTINGGGEVGIGTTSPSAKLDVHDGDLELMQATGVNNVSKGIIKFGENSVRNFAIQYDGSLNNPNNKLFIKTTASGTDNLFETTAMTFTQNGSIGIGTTTPDTKLHINQSSSTPVITLQRSEISKKGHIGYGTANDGGIYLGTTDNQYALWVQQNGAVGIGTTDPTRTLQVVGSMSAATQGTTMDVTTNGDVIITLGSGA